MSRATDAWNWLGIDGLRRAEVRVRESLAPPCLLLRQHVELSEHTALWMAVLPTPGEAVYTLQVHGHGLVTSNLPRTPSPVALRRPNTPSQKGNCTTSFMTPSGSGMAMMSAGGCHDSGRNKGATCGECGSPWVQHTSRGATTRSGVLRRWVRESNCIWDPSLWASHF